MARPTKSEIENYRDAYRKKYSAVFEGTDDDIRSLYHIAPTSIPDEENEWILDAMNNIREDDRASLQNLDNKVALCRTEFEKHFGFPYAAENFQIVRHLQQRGVMEAPTESDRQWLLEAMRRSHMQSIQRDRVTAQRIETRKTTMLAKKQHEEGLPRCYVIRSPSGFILGIFATLDVAKQSIAMTFSPDTIQFDQPLKSRPIWHINTPHLKLNGEMSYHLLGYIDERILNIEPTIL